MSLAFTIIPVTGFAQNATLLWCTQTREGALCDPGGQLELLLKAVEKHGVILKQILITHGHIDHAGGAAELAVQCHVPIIGPHRADQFWLDQLPEQARRFGFDGKTTAFISDRYLEDGDTVMVGQESLQVIHCPGHTPGHVVFYHQPSQLAVVGDVIFKGSVGRTDFPQGHGPTLIKSIREKLFPLGDAVRFNPGHGPMSTFGEERADNPFVADWAVRS